MAGLQETRRRLLPLVLPVALPLALRCRWGRFRRDLAAAAVGVRAWVPLVLGSTVVSGGILAVQAVDAERQRHDLIRRTALQQLDLLAENLAIETRDWAQWDET